MMASRRSAFTRSDAFDRAARFLGGASAERA
jgi:hypothetical protein